MLLKLESKQYIDVMMKSGLEEMKDMTEEQFKENIEKDLFLRFGEGIQRYFKEEMNVSEEVTGANKYSLELHVLTKEEFEYICSLPLLVKNDPESITLEEIMIFIDMISKGKSLKEIKEEIIKTKEERENV